MRIISLIDDAAIIKKILKTPGLMACQAQTASVRQSAWGGPTEAFIIYDHSSAPSADDYLIDADYPMETSGTHKAFRH